MLTLAAVWRSLPGARLASSISEGDRDQAFALQAAEGIKLTGVSTDTRSLMPGALFVALRGPTHDGHDHVEAARARGAAALLVDHPLAVDLPQIVVADTRIALGLGAQAWRSRFTLPVIAVTGSNGKTSVTQMLAAILKNAFGGDALATQGNLNNDIGLPLMLWQLREHHRAAVFELGTNHPGEIAPLAAMCQASVALVNNAQREHQEFFTSVEATAEENGAAIAALPAHGTAVFPADDRCAPIWRRLASDRAVIDFALGTGQGAAALTASFKPSVLADAVPGDGAQGHSVHMRTPVGSIDVVLSVAGRHQVHNAVAATAAAVAAGVAPEAIVAGLAGFTAVSGRGVRHRLSERLSLIDDSYNANPDSMRAAIDLLAAEPLPADGLRVLVAGDMGEVGTHGSAFHAEIGAWARARGVDLLLAHGAAMHAAVAAFVVPPPAASAASISNRQMPMAAAVASSGQPASAPSSEARAVHFDHVPDLIDALRLAISGAASRQIRVLVKGSRSMRMERVVAALTDSSAGLAGPTAPVAATH